jgi:hypothetical protein
MFHLNRPELFPVQDSRLDPGEFDGFRHLVDLTFDQTLGKTFHHLK